MSNSLDLVKVKGKKVVEADPELKEQLIWQVLKENQFHIVFNRPQQMNSFSLGMLMKFKEFVDKANEMEPIKYIVVRGNGKNFTSGNDLNNFTNGDLLELADMRTVTKWVSLIVQEFVESVIKSQKPIFSLVDGKAIGFGFTVLALFDKNFVTEKSSYMAPLVKLAQGPEMCSSYTFPKIFGKTLAEDLLIQGKWIQGKDLQKHGMASCFKDLSEAEQALQGYIGELEELDWQSYIKARQLMRNDTETLLRRNEAECKNLAERWSSEDLPVFIMKYMANRKAQSQKPKL